jgi:hypothetical protein
LASTAAQQQQSGMKRSVARLAASPPAGPSVGVGMAAALSNLASSFRCDAIDAAGRRCGATPWEGRQAQRRAFRATRPGAKRLDAACSYSRSSHTLKIPPGALELERRMRHGKASRVAGGGRRGGMDSESPTGLLSRQDRGERRKDRGDRLLPATCMLSLARMISTPGSQPVRCRAEAEPTLDNEGSLSEHGVRALLYISRRLSRLSSKRHVAGLGPERLVLFGIRCPSEVTSGWNPPWSRCPHHFHGLSFSDSADDRWSDVLRSVHMP